jgi:hypothetical protein
LTAGIDRKRLDRKSRKDYFMRKMNVIILAGMIILSMVFVSCQKKSAAEQYADSVKKVAEAYSDAIVSATGDYAEQLTDLAGATAALGSVLAETSDSEEESSSTESVDWKKALDDYEAFVDEYVTFMKKYKDNPTDMSLLSDYATMSEKATTASDSIEKVKEDLSTENIAEFLTRYNNIIAKMAAAM